MSKLVFKPEMFLVNHGALTPVGMADVAQKVFNEWLEKQTVVYGYGIGAMKSSLWNMNGPEKERQPHTHKAYLVCIEDIKGCEHNGHITVIQKGLFKCSDCDKELKPKNGWEEA